MKRLILTISIIAFAFGVSAQLGITASADISKYSYAESKLEIHRKSILAYNFGIQYKKELSEKLFVLPELNYSLKGSRGYYDYPIGLTGPMKNLNNFQYIQLNLPVIALPISEDLDYEIGGGPFAAYLLKATQKTVEFDDSFVTQSFAPSDLEKMDAGLHFRYDLELINIQGNTGAAMAKTRNFPITMSWLFSKND